MPTNDTGSERTPAYRWTLERDLGDLLAPAPKHVLVCGLNPSTADAERDDPTSRRVIGFARREQATRLTMVNVYAARTTDPKRLKDFDDPVGAANDRTIAEAARDADLIIAAWGRPPGKTGEARARRVLELLTAAGDVYRLGPATRDGHPPHPLYLPASEAATPLQLHAPRRPKGPPESTSSSNFPRRGRDRTGRDPPRRDPAALNL